MKIAVCDDETKFIDNTCTMLEGWAKEQKVGLSLYRFSDGDALLQSHRKEAYDLIFLDVLMPAVNGIDTAKKLRVEDSAVSIVFLTSAREFALESYEVKAFQYLLKPLEEDRLRMVLDDYVNSLYRAEDTILMQTRDGFCRLSVDEVDYIEAQNKHVHIYLAGGAMLSISESFSRCGEIFTPEKGFCKSHRSFLVNLNHIKEFTKTQIFMGNGAFIPISRNCYANFKEMYFSWFFS